MCSSNNPLDFSGSSALAGSHCDRLTMVGYAGVDALEGGKAFLLQGLVHVFGCRTRLGCLV